MKTCSLFLLLATVQLSAQTCFDTPDGIETDATAGWSYVDFEVPNGLRVDSIYFDADRPGFPVDEFDFILGHTVDSDTYVPFMDETILAYLDFNDSMYSTWIDLTGFDLDNGVLRAYLPVNAGAIWNEVCFATSYTSEPIPCYLPELGLAGWYPFNGNTNDESGNAQHGENQGAGYVSDRYGQPSSACQLNGSTDHVEVPSGGGTSLDFTGAYTVSLWLKTTDTNGFLLAFGDVVTGNGQGYSLATSASGVIVQNGVGVLTGSGTSVSDDAWHQVVSVYDAGAVNFYIDGVWISEITGYSDPSSWSGSRLFGKRSDFFGGAQSYAGILDDVALWNRALDLCEIEVMYKGALANPCAANYAQGDLDCDGVINTSDIILLIGNFGVEVE